MTKPRKPSPADLERLAADMSPARIDVLYGLEPIYEPGESLGMRRTRGRTLQEFVAVVCPYCGERFDTRIDLSAGAQRYIEDCQVCCQPMEMQVALGSDGALLAVTTERAS